MYINLKLKKLQYKRERRIENLLIKCANSLTNRNQLQRGIFNSTYYGINDSCKSKLYMVASARVSVLIGKYLKHGKPQRAEVTVSLQAWLNEKNSHHVNFQTICAIRSY